MTELKLNQHTSDIVQALQQNQKVDADKNLSAWKRIDAAVAFWTILAGSSVGIVWYALRSPFGIEPLWPSLAVGIPILIALTFMRKHSQSQ